MSRDWFYSCLFHIRVSECVGWLGVLLPHWNTREHRAVHYGWTLMREKNRLYFYHSLASGISKVCVLIKVEAKMSRAIAFSWNCDWSSTYPKPWTNRSKKNTINRWWVYQNISYEARLQNNAINNVGMEIHALRTFKSRNITQGLSLPHSSHWCHDLNLNTIKTVILQSRQKATRIDQ